MARKVIAICSHCGSPIYEGEEVWGGIGGEYCAAECLDRAESGEGYYDDDEYYEDYEMFL